MLNIVQKRLSNEIAGDTLRANVNNCEIYPKAKLISVARKNTQPIITKINVISILKGLTILPVSLSKNNLSSISKKP